MINSEPLGPHSLSRHSFMPGGALVVGVCDLENARFVQGFAKDLSAATTSAIDDVQSALLNIERGLPDGFAQGGMRMGGAADIFGAATKLND